MFDVAPTELLVVAIVALVVIGPKDLPKAMRFVGKWVGKARAMSRHFRSGIDAMMREAELEEMQKQWREHNEAIMRAHPHVATPPAAALPAPDEGGSADAVPAQTGAAGSGGASAAPTLNGEPLRIAPDAPANDAQSAPAKAGEGSAA